MGTIRICIANDFSTTPGPRKRDDGTHSGQQFREEVLGPRYLQAKERGDELLVDLDGTEGYATSFLEEAFGGLARENDPADILQRLTFKSDDEPYTVEEIRTYIREARNS